MIKANHLNEATSANNRLEALKGYLGASELGQQYPNRTDLY